MKTWKCPRCSRIHESKENITMVLCPSCIDIYMEEVFENFKSKNELKGGLKDGKNKKY